MIDYLRLEARLSASRWLWLALAGLGVLRLSRVVGPSEGWVTFLSVTYPLLVSISAVHLLDQERRWKTVQVLVASPMSTRAVFPVRLLVLAAPLVGLLFLLVPLDASLELLAPAILLASVVLTFGGTRRAEEWGAGIALVWWIASFLLFLNVGAQARTCVRWLSVIAFPRSETARLSSVVPLSKLGVAAFVLFIPILRETLRLTSLRRS